MSYRSHFNGYHLLCAMASGIIASQTMCAQDIIFNSNGMEQYGLHLLHTNSLIIKAAYPNWNGDKFVGFDRYLSYSVTVQHNGASPLLALMVRYDLTSSTGKKIFFNLLRYNPDPQRTAQHFQPGSQIFVSPSPLVSRCVTGQAPDCSLVQAEINDRLAILQQQKVTEISIDSIVFQDGLLVGPDKAQTLDRLNAIRAAEADIISELLQLDSNNATDMLVVNALEHKGPDDNLATSDAKYYYGIAQRAMAHSLLGTLQGAGRAAYRAKLLQLSRRVTLPEIHRQ